MIRYLLASLLIFSAANGSQERNYFSGYSEEDKKQWNFILTTLANKPLTKLFALRPQLNRAGDSIDHVHPLQLMLMTFTDDELKVAIRNMQKRGGMVWSQFISDMSKSFSDEVKANNMQDSAINDFCAKLKLQRTIVYGSIKQGKWHHFINLLIKHLPRESRDDPWDD